MVTQNSNNLKVTNNADGYDVAGGTTERKLTVTGADISLTGSGTNTFTFPTSTDTLVGRASTDTLTNKSISADQIGNGDVSDAELSYINSVTSNVQTQLGNKLGEVKDDTSPEAGGEFNFGAHSAGFTAQTATGDGTTTIDWKLGNKMHFTAGAMDETFTFTAPSNECSLTLKIKQDSVGSRDMTWPASVTWLGTEPTWSDGDASKTIIVTFYYDGTTYWGAGTSWEA